MCEKRGGEGGKPKKSKREQGRCYQTEQGVISISCIKAQARIRANKEWEGVVARLNSSRGYTTFKKPRDRIPKIPLELQKVPKELASRFFQLASGRAMTAPFLKERLGWNDSDVCWWCSSGRQTREHLFMECLTWKKKSGNYGRRLGGCLAHVGKTEVGTGEERVSIWADRKEVAQHFDGRAIRPLGPIWQTRGLCRRCWLLAKRGLESSRRE